MNITYLWAQCDLLYLQILSDKSSAATTTTKQQVQHARGFTTTGVVPG